jgi:hypothetical protein
LLTISGCRGGCGCFRAASLEGQLDTCKEIQLQVAVPTPFFSSLIVSWSFVGVVHSSSSYSSCVVVLFTQATPKPKKEGEKPKKKAAPKKKEAGEKVKKTPKKPKAAKPKTTKPTKPKAAKPKAAKPKLEKKAAKPKAPKAKKAAPAKAE